MNAGHATETVNPNRAGQPTPGPTPSAPETTGAGTGVAAAAPAGRQAQRGTDADEVADSWPRWPRREQELRGSLAGKLRRKGHCSMIGYFY